MLAAVSHVIQKIRLVTLSVLAIGTFVDPRQMVVAIVDAFVTQAMQTHGVLSLNVTAVSLLGVQMPSNF